MTTLTKQSNAFAVGSYDPTPPPPSTLGYLQNLVAFQVAALTGALAPTNAVETYFAATSAGWRASREGGDIVGPWTGGWGDQSRNELVSFGGGHNDVSNNGAYVYDFSGTTKPTGMSILAGSQSLPTTSPANLDPNSMGSAPESYTDGKAAARHTYGGIIYAGRKVFTFGGSLWGNGNTTHTTRTFDAVTGTWNTGVAEPAILNPQGDARCAACYDLATGKVFVVASTLNGWGIFSTVTGAWVASGSLGGMSGWTDIVMELDTRRSRAVLFGTGYTNSWIVNFSTNTVTASISHGNYRSLSNYGSRYDALRDRFWLYGGRWGGWTSITEVDAATLAVVAERACSGSAVTFQTDPVGQKPFAPYQRMVLLGATNDAIGFTSDFNAPAYVLKLPSYYATPNLTENPISDSGKWINGGSVGLDWKNCQIVNGIIQHTGINTGPPYNDSHAILGGTWSADQYFRGTVHLPTVDLSATQEFGVRFRSSISAHSSTGYELLMTQGGPSANCEVVWWKGPIDTFQELGFTTLPSGNPALRDGDVIDAQIVGSTVTLKVNGVVRMTYTGATQIPSGGSPGVNFFTRTLSAAYGFRNNPIFSNMPIP